MYVLMHQVNMNININNLIGRLWTYRIDFRSSTTLAY